jgi:hypothetical protein
MADKARNTQTPNSTTNLDPATEVWLAALERADDLVKAADDGDDPAAAARARKRWRGLLKNFRKELLQEPDGKDKERDGEGSQSAR